MTIKRLLRVGDALNAKDKAIGVGLKMLSRAHVGEFDVVPGIGFGSESCNAAVAVTRTGNVAAAYSDGLVGLAGANDYDFAVVYGSSRLYTGLDAGYLDAAGGDNPCNPFSSSGKEQHAEQTAIRMADELQLNFWAGPDGCHHLYVDFSPCNKCGPWLQKRPENWVVHYGESLADKASFTGQRRAFANVYNRELKHHPSGMRSGMRLALDLARQEQREGLFEKKRKQPKPPG